jgi:hypothetical protein
VAWLLKGQFKLCSCWQSAVGGCVRLADAGDRAGCFELTAEFGVVDGQPPQVAEGGFELAGEVVAFAAAQFLDLSDQDALARPSFESMPAGLSLQAAHASATHPAAGRFYCPFGHGPRRRRG